jgi:putative transposase
MHRCADQWYVCFSCVVEVDQPAAPDRPAVGIDVGLEYFAMLSTGEHIPNPRHFRRGEAVLAKRQQSLARTKRDSKSRRRATQRVHNAALAILNRAGLARAAASAPAAEAHML